jgi:hypothetical protein
MKLKQPDWPTLIADLQARGLSEAKIGAHIGCSQMNINLLRRGVTTDPRYMLGMRLLALHKHVCRRAGFGVLKGIPSSCPAQVPESADLTDGNACIDDAGTCNRVATEAAA